MTQRERRAALNLRAPRPWRYTLVAVFVPLLVAALLLGLRHEYRRSEELRTQAAQSFDRRIAQVTLLSELKDAETAQRGYLLTGDAAFLAPYEPARRAVSAQLAAMRHADSATVAADYAPRIAGLVDAKFAELDRTIALVRDGRRTEALAIVAAGRGKRVMDALRTTIGASIAVEETRSAYRRAAFVAHRAQLQRIVWLVFLGLVALLLAFLFVLWGMRHERYAAMVDAFEAAERNATILDSTIDAIIILNPSGTVEVVNAAASAMLGYASVELERRDIATIIDIAPGDGSFHKRVGLIDGQLRRSFLADRVVRHRDGREIAVDVAMGVMNVPSGDHLVVSLRDIAERKRVERVKDDLMSTVSHELRTPLTSVVGSLGLLRAGTAGLLAPDAARLVEIAENNSRRLIRLINDMLDIDRIESGKLHMARDPIDLRVVLDQACIGSEGLARAGGVRLACHQPDQPVMVSGDADRLLQVMTNLASNAIRVSAVGSVVDLSLETLDGHAIVKVEDRGPGIPTHFRDRIFGRFERAARDDGSTGTGLGLAISREIISRHDGTIWFEDRTGGGTRFAFALTRIGAAAQADDKAPRVLVCVADEAIAANLVAIAVNEGCAYDYVRSCAAARSAMTARDYAALLVDIALPEEGGLAFARAAREGDPPFDGPIIIVAPAAGGNDAPAPLDVIDWIDKPGDIDRLAGALRTALLRTGARRPVVLHLDDDRDLLEIVSAALEPEVRLITATDLPGARALLETITPDAVILDIQLADGTGLELLPFLVDEAGLAIPTVIYSAQDISADIAMHSDAVLVKARGSIPDLKATVRRVVRARAGAQAGRDDEI